MIFLIRVGFPLFVVFGLARASLFMKPAFLGTQLDSGARNRSFERCVPFGEERVYGDQLSSSID